MINKIISGGDYMTKKVYEGSIRTVENTERHKKDFDMNKGRLVIKNEDGLTIVITGADSLTEGFVPEENCKITIERNQKTINESV